MHKLTKEQNERLIKAAKEYRQEVIERGRRNIFKDNIFKGVNKTTNP